jgi:3-hydroxyisobutyrate dehydrogenase-like beta-hydroxyacid dehydrogenase
MLHQLQRIEVDLLFPSPHIPLNPRKTPSQSFRSNVLDIKTNKRYISNSNNHNTRNQTKPPTMPPTTTTPTTTTSHIGYIGLGNAGYSLASNLPKAGYHLIVHDTDPSKPLKAASEWPNTTAASDSESLSSAFSNCSVIITMLPHGKIVRDVLLGPQGIAASLKPRTIIIDTSSSSPFDTQALGEELAQRDLTLVDSPITQTYMHATDAGESTFMVGCDSDSVYKTVERILKCMGSYIFHMGPLGAGHAMKTLNNYIMASSICALADSLVTGQKFGLEPAKMVEVLNVGTGVCFPTLDTFRRDGLTGRFESGFGLGLLVKDLGITEEFMERSGFRTGLPGMLRGYLQDGLDRVDPRADHTACLVGWEERSGVALNKTREVKEIPREDFEHRLRGLNRPG